MLESNEIARFLDSSSFSSYSSLFSFPSDDISSRPFAGLYLIKSIDDLIGKSGLHARGA